MSQILSRNNLLLKAVTDLDAALVAELAGLMMVYQGGSVKKVTVEALLNGLAYSADVAATYLTIASIQNITGQKTFSNTIKATASAFGLTIDTATGAESKIGLLNNGSTRWSVASDGTTESGGNTGSALEVRRFNDAGTLIDAPLKINRADGSTVLKSASIDSASGSASKLGFGSDGLPRWEILKSTTAETGSNLGSDLTFNRYSDAGVYIDTPLTIARSTGITSFTKDITSTANIITTGEIQAKSINAARAGTAATEHTIQSKCNSTTGLNISAISAVSENVDSSTLQVTGKEKDTGTIKVSHIKPTGISDVNAAALSLDMQGTGTAAKGLYINSTASTTGDLIDIRNNTVQQVRVTSSGALSCATDLSAPEGRLSVKVPNNTDIGVSIRANADAGADLLRIKKADGSTQVSVGSTGTLTTTGNLITNGSLISNGSLVANTTVQCKNTTKAASIDTPDAVDGRLSFESDGTQRWQMIRKATSNDLTVQRYNSSGNFQDTPLTLASSTGALTVSKDATFNGTQVTVNNELRTFGGVQVRDAAVPGNPVSGNVLYSESGALKFKDSAGAISNLTALVATNLNSPAFTGTPTAPTPAVTDNTTKLATTEYVTKNRTTDFVYATVGYGQTVSSTGYSDISQNITVKFGAMSAGVWTCTRTGWWDVDIAIGFLRTTGAVFGRSLLELYTGTTIVFRISDIAPAGNVTVKTSTSNLLYLTSGVNYNLRTYNNSDGTIVVDQGGVIAFRWAGLNGLGPTQ